MAKIKLLSIASTPDAQEQGLQFVQHLSSMTGMLFRFSSPRVLNFWMRDTYVPLEIAFVDGEGKIVKTERMAPLSLRTVSSGRPCVMALEVPTGTLETAGFDVGKKIKVDEKGMTVEIDEENE